VRQVTSLTPNHADVNRRQLFGDRCLLTVD
jgi:hypothetical protein